MEFSISREMTITIDDFFRLLPNALKYKPFQVQDNVIHVQLETGKADITLSPQHHRKIGSLSLPIININFKFEDCTNKECQDFFIQFDMAFQKGGG